MSTEMQKILSESECIYTESQINKSIAELAKKIEEKIYPLNPLVMPILDGAVMFSAALLKHFSFPFDVDYMHLTRYRGKTVGSSLEWKKKPTAAIENRDVVIVDDIFDEGYTLSEAAHYCKNKNAKSVLTVVLALKEHNRSFNNTLPDYYALKVPDRYVFGFGMDYKNNYRDLTSIYALNE